MSSLPPNCSRVALRSAPISLIASTEGFYNRLATHGRGGIDIFLLVQLTGMEEDRWSLISSVNPVIHLLKLVTSAADLQWISPPDGAAYMW